MVQWPVVAVRLRSRSAQFLIEINIGAGVQRLRAGRLVETLVPRVRDLRGGGSAAAALAVAGGRLDGHWGPGLHAWDAAAGILVVCEAAGQPTDLDGAPTGICPASGDILAGAANLHRQLKALLRWVHGSDTSPLPTLSATGEH
jgi:myo-inositol-1(or 4)-monophosphatase